MTIRSAMAAAEMPPELPPVGSATDAKEALEIRRLLGLHERAGLVDIANRIAQLNRAEARHRRTAESLLFALSAQMEL